MPTVYPSPFGPCPQFETATGAPAVGDKLFFYVAGSNTKQDTYTTAAGTTANANPIVLNSLGQPSTEIWFTSGQIYKMVWAPSTDTDPPASPIRTWDNLRGMGDVTTTITVDEWITYGAAATYISGTSFSVVGNQTSTFQIGRRVKTTNSGGTVVYSTITNRVFGAVTTVTLSNDSGSLDSGLSAVAYGIVSATNTSAPTTLARSGANSDITSLTGLTGAISGPTALTGAAAGMTVSNATSVNSGQLAGMRNRITNGDARVKQRAAPTLTAAYQYGAVDRFMAAVGGGTGISGTIGQLSNSGFSSGLGVGAVAASWTTGNVLVQQRIEAANVKDMNGKVVTFSGKVYHDFGSTRTIAVSLRKPTALDNHTSQTVLGTDGSFSAPSGVVTSFSFTVTLGATDADNGLAVLVYDNAVNTVTNKNFAVGDLQLEIGSVATPFEQRPFGLELMLCQRYYEKSFPYATTPAQNLGVDAASGAFCFMAPNAGAGNERSHDCAFRVRKRATPTMTGFNPSAANAQVRDINIPGDCSGTTFIPWDNGFRVTCTGNAGTAQWGVLQIAWAAEAEL